MDGDVVLSGDSLKGGDDPFKMVSLCPPCTWPTEEEFVCGSDGETYQNQAHLECEAKCKKPGRVILPRQLRGKFNFEVFN